MELVPDLAGVAVSLLQGDRVSRQLFAAARGDHLLDRWHCGLASSLQRAPRQVTQRSVLVAAGKNRPLPSLQIPLPPKYSDINSELELSVTKVIGGCGFVISSGLIMLEVQERWYTPNLRSLGWHIGFWNLVGAIGFTLCGALGYGVGQPGIEYASTLSTFVGSWAFLVSRVGSTLVA